MDEELLSLLDHVRHLDNPWLRTDGYTNDPISSRSQWTLPTQFPSTAVETANSLHNHIALPDPHSDRRRGIENTHHRPPTISAGHSLVPVNCLPDRARSIFPFQHFNAVQSQSFQQLYRGDDNFVLSAPTGSGKTVAFELAILRAIQNYEVGTFKVVYMAPIKALCSERCRDWKAKFPAFNLRVAEVTGDSDSSTLTAVRDADIIVTTPEKWDSMTRKWKDHEKLVRMIRLLLIDEVHILGKDRGPTLEAVVSRMKSMESQIRFIALSATIPNCKDIALWLGLNSRSSQFPAMCQEFGEEYRPVKLQRHVVAYNSTSNDFQFEAYLSRQ